MDYRVTTDLSKMDFEAIHEFISHSYWAEGMPPEALRKALENSLCFGLLRSDKQIGFARMITDRTTFAYLSDVFVLSEYRGRGLGKLLMDEVMGHADLQGLRRIMLATRDAHSFYTGYGFEKINDPSRLMQILDPDIYKRNR